MEFYDLFRDLIGYIPERFSAVSSFFYAAMPFVLMACALFTAFFGLKCAKWWSALTFFFLGASLSSKYLLPAVNIYDYQFWMVFGACLIIGVLCAYFSKYLFRAQLAVSEFLIIYAALPSFLFYFGDIPAKLISVIVALSVVFLTVKYKYLIVLPTTAFTGSFIFWGVALNYVDFGNKTLNGIITGIAATAFQCYISREQIEETYKDVKMKYKKTEQGSKRAVHYVEHKLRKDLEDLKNIELQGAKNIRDLGGLPVKGGVIKPCVLLRGGHLGTLSDDDIDKLILNYKLKTVIDLRNEQEKKEIPDIVLPNFNYTEMPVFDSKVPGMTHEAKQDLAAVPDMRKLYEYVMNSPCVDNIAKIIRRIVKADEEDFAFLYHCTEGKDRTGIITALLLTVLGADREIILEDYLYTNTVNRKKAKKYYWLVRIFKRNKPAAERVKNVFLAKEDYINEVFKAIDKVGEESYIRNVLKLTQSEVDAFKQRVIEYK